MKKFREIVIFFFVRVAFVASAVLSEDNIQNFCGEKNCFRKCCPENFALIGAQCQETSTSEFPDILTEYLGQNNNHTLIAGNGVFCIHNNTFPIEYHWPEFRFLGNAIFVADENAVLQYEEFCLEHFVNESGHYEAGLLACFSQQVDAADNVKRSGK